jgi:hypothetical protein
MTPSGCERTQRHDPDQELTMRQGSPTRYLYIVGRGHSGSTIFSMLMRESGNVASEGEIVIGFRPGFESKRCANGEVFSGSPFWTRVAHAFEQRTGDRFADGVRVLNERAFCFNALGQLLAPSGSPRVQEEKRLLEALYDSIAEVSDRPVVLDSSKELSVAIFLLRQVPEAKLIHFVRSPFGVADSYVKRVKAARSFHVFRIGFKVERLYFVPMIISALLWSVESMVCGLLRLVYPKRIITVHYEDLCAQPTALLERLEAFTGLSLAGAKAAAVERRIMQPGHALSANRLMRGEKIAFSPKLGLTRNLTWFDKAVVALCTFPMALAYGYFGRRALKPAVVMQQLPQ